MKVIFTTLYLEHLFAIVVKLYVKSDFVLLLKFNRYCFSHETLSHTSFHTIQLYGSVSSSDPFNCSVYLKLQPPRSLQKDWIHESLLYLTLLQNRFFNTAMIELQENITYCYSRRLSRFWILQTSSQSRELCLPAVAPLLSLNIDVTWCVCAPSTFVLRTRPIRVYRRHNAKKIIGFRLISPVGLLIWIENKLIRTLTGIEHSSLRPVCNDILA